MGTVAIDVKLLYNTGALIIIYVGALLMLAVLVKNKALLWTLNVVVFTVLLGAEFVLVRYYNRSAGVKGAGISQAKDRQKSGSEEARPARSSFNDMRRTKVSAAAFYDAFRESDGSQKDR